MKKYLVRACSELTSVRWQTAKKRVVVEAIPGNTEGGDL